MVGSSPGTARSAGLPKIPHSTVAWRRTIESSFYGAFLNFGHAVDCIAWFSKTNVDHFVDLDCQHIQ